MPDMHSTTQVERRQSGRNGYAYPALVPPDGVEPPDRLTAVVDRLRRFVSSPLRELVLAADESALLSHRRDAVDDISRHRDKLRKRGDEPRAVAAGREAR